MPNSRKKLVVLGATGSIGTSTLDLVKRYADRFEVIGVSARGRAAELAAIVDEFEVPAATITDEAARFELLERRPDLEPRLTSPGAAGLLELLERCPGATVVNGLVGAAGLVPTVAALNSGMDVALANKEALVVGGELVLAAAAGSGARLWPVDSEHSAIAQCLRGNPDEELRRIWLTASGGPFRDTDPAMLAGVTLAQVLDHPTWDMGPKITVDSATMMNKGLEVLEAHLLFGTPLAEIRVVIHRQSIVHSMVELRDGAFLAQLGAPDMRVPILFALSEGEHWEGGFAPFDPVAAGPLTFEEPDGRRYPCLILARRAAEMGGAAPIVLNAANEEAVAGVLAEDLSFVEIPPIIERALESISLAPVRSVDEALDRDHEARVKARELVAVNSRAAG